MATPTISAHYSIRQRSNLLWSSNEQDVSYVVQLNRLIERLSDASIDTSPKHSFLDNPKPGVALNNLYLETELGPIDLLGSIKGVGDFDRVRAASLEIELFGRRCRVISIEALIQAKEAMGRDKDMLAAKELRAIAENQRQT